MPSYYCYVFSLPAIPSVSHSASASSLSRPNERESRPSNTLKPTKLAQCSKPSTYTNPTLNRNHRGEPLSRFGARYILRRYAQKAHVQVPRLTPKRVHPHSLRHSTAVFLLRSGVDLVTISHWLGHSSVETTNRYAAVDLETKRQALERAGPINKGAEPSLAAWRDDASILSWLEAL